jgi:hypothetical protein
MHGSQSLSAKRMRRDDTEPFPDRRHARVADRKHSLDTIATQFGGSWGNAGCRAKAVAKGWGLFGPPGACNEEAFFGKISVLAQAP